MAENKVTERNDEKSALNSIESVTEASSKTSLNALNGEEKSVAPFPASGLEKGFYKVDKNE